MNGIKLTAATAALALFAGAASAQDVLRVGTEGAYPPYNSTNAAGELIGFEIDLANELCARMDMTCEFVAQDWDGIIPALENGRYDVIMAGMSITDERRERIAFTQGYSTTPANFVVMADSDLAGLETMEEVMAAFDGATVGVQSATIHQNFLDQEMGDAVSVQLYPTQEDLQLDMLSGRVDAGLADYSAWQAFFESEDGADFTTTGPDLTGADYPVFGEGVGIGLRQDDTELLAQLNAALCEVKADGTLEAMAQEWFGFNASMPAGDACG